MSLPPEQINIKRRREEEPVDTLCKKPSSKPPHLFTLQISTCISFQLIRSPDIQSELHQTKRRFTDFVFQRVLASGKQPSESTRTSPSPVPAAQRALRSPRSASSINFPPPRETAARNAAAAASGVPLVRATSPGAEFRDERRLAAARKETEEKLSRALHSSPAQTGLDARVNVDAGGASGRSSTLSGHESRTSSPSASSVRKFQISRSSTPISLRKGTGSGVHKRRGDSMSGVAVLVEKLRQKPLSRKASLVSDLLTAEGTAPAQRAHSPLVTEEPARPRKRPVVNQAEKRWREERKSAISTAKQRISKMAGSDQGDADDESSERLAQQFEQIALELESGMDATPTETKDIPAPESKPTLPKSPLKYQPRLPNKPRPNAPATDNDTMQVDKSQAHEKDGHDDDDDYVYDTYIRRPLPSPGDSQVTNPLADLEANQDAWFRHNGIDMSRPDVGVIVITEEDEAYWEHFAEDDEDEDRWDSEDADSNGM